MLKLRNRTFFIKYTLNSQHDTLQAHENGEEYTFVSLTMKNDVIEFLS